MMRHLIEAVWVSVVGFAVSNSGVAAEQLQRLRLTGPETEKRFPPLVVPDGLKATLFACDPIAARKLASPVNHVKKDMKSLLVIHADNDRSIPIENALGMVEALKTWMRSMNSYGTNLPDTWALLPRL